ncbi:MAG: hypothetical protein ACFE9Z_08655 [Promethearchaeota archaeon]
MSSLLFLSLCLSNQIFSNTIVLSNKFDLNINASGITIDTPKNTTYNRPISGYYPATYGFENETDGTSGTSIGFVHLKDTGCSVLTLSELDQHRKILHYNTPIGYRWVRNRFDSSKTSGSVEFWIRFGENDKRHVIYLEDDSGGSISLNWWENGSVTYDDGGTQTIIEAYNALQWYHVRIEFDLATDWHLWIDGVSKDGGTGYGYDAGNPASFEEFRFGGLADSDFWLDAVAYSWDQDYTIGDNQNEGLLLNFDITFVPDWLGYSLDGQINKTISGNTTIPLPGNGTHSIQVFGNDTLGKNYNSDKIFFSVSTGSPGSLGWDLFITFVYISLFAIILTILVLIVLILYLKKKKKQKSKKHEEEIEISPPIRKEDIEEVKKLTRIPIREARIERESIIPPQQTLPFEEDKSSVIDKKIELNYSYDNANLCAMHKERFEGQEYRCSYCNTLYCAKCAYSLAEKSQECIFCGTPIVFEDKILELKKKKQKKKKEKEEIKTEPQDKKFKLKDIFESNLLLENIDQVKDVKLTFIEKDFFKEVEKLELEESEKQGFIREMLSLTPQERKNLIIKILHKHSSEIFHSVESKILKEIFESENLVEKINQAEKVNLTFFQKDFFKKIEKLSLNPEERYTFIRDMLNLTPKERNQVLRKILGAKKGEG